MKSIPESHRDLLGDAAKAYASLVTMNADNTPQVTPVWFSWDGQHVLVNSAQGRLKDRNMRARPQVAVLIVDPTNPYRWLQIQGKVVDITTQGARDHINALNNKYHGDFNYPVVPGEVRVIYTIEPEKVSAG